MVPGDLHVYLVPWSLVSIGDAKLPSPPHSPLPTHLSFTGIPSLPSSGKKLLQMPFALTWVGFERGLPHHPFCFTLSPPPGYEQRGYFMGREGVLFCLLCP